MLSRAVPGEKLRGRERPDIVDGRTIGGRCASEFNDAHASAETRSRPGLDTPRETFLARRPGARAPLLAPSPPTSPPFNYWPGREIYAAAVGIRPLATSLRNIWYNNSRYQVPLITLNPQPGHTPCSLNFRVILIFRQLPSAYTRSFLLSFVLSTRRAGVGAAFIFRAFLRLASFLPRGPWHRKRTCVYGGRGEFRVCERARREKVSTTTRRPRGRYINNDLRSASARILYFKND